MIRAKAAARLLLVTGVVVALGGCGAEVKISAGDKPDTLSGETLASKANAQLEKENAELVPGDLTCEDVKFEVGATSDCLRTVELEGGRLVRIGATATIDRVKDGGHFQIQVDEAPQEFGMTGEAVYEDLSTQYADQYETDQPEGSCEDYLLGEVDSQITCTLDTEDGPLSLVVTVTEVDPENYDTSYTFEEAS